MSTMHKTAAGIHIAVTCDANYAMPLAAMLVSLTALLDPRRRLVIHALGQDLPEEIWDKLRISLPDDRIEWNRIDVNASRLLAEGFTTRAYEHFSPVTYFRLLLPELLPESLEKVLYLDSDLIVCDDISPLWETDVAAVDLAAVPEHNIAAGRASAPRGIRFYRKLGMQGEQVLFNAGVLLINLARWRRSKLALRAFTYLRHVGDDVRWYEQEALNVVVNDNYRRLCTRWNLPPHDAPRRQENPVSIVHYLTAQKPWHWDYLGPLRKLFFDALDRTQWSGWRPRRPWFGRPKRLLARFNKAMCKRRYALERLYRKLHRGFTYRLVAPEPRSSGSPTLSQRFASSEIRLFLSVRCFDDALGKVLAAYFLAGVDRALVLDRSGLGGASRIPPEQRSRLQIFVCSGASAEAALRRLLDRYGEAHWCVLGDECRMIVDESGSPAHLRAYCAGLDADGIDLVEAVTGPGDRLEMIARDLRSGRVFRGTALVGSTAHAYDKPVFGSRAVLVKYRKNMLLDAAAVLAGNVRKSERYLRFKDLECSSEP